MRPAKTKRGRDYLFSDGAGVVAVFAAGEAVVGGSVSVAGVAVVAGVAAGVAAGCGVASSSTDCSTERVPVRAGSDNVSATSMNSAAATIVIFASSVCVPRGPKAVLETELVNSAPASALPGCNRTAMIITMQARIKSAYKK